MQALCGLQGIFDLFNCKTPGFPPGGTEMFRLRGSRFFNEIAHMFA